MAILLAVGMTLLLGTMTQLAQFSESAAMHRMLVRAQKQEAFTTNELAAWANYLVKGSTGKTVVVDNNYLDRLPASLTGSYPGAGYTAGLPVDLLGTSPLDKEGSSPSSTFLRSYNGTNLQFISNSANSCGSESFGNKKFQLCLVASSSGKSVSGTLSSCVPSGSSGCPSDTTLPTKPTYLITDEASLGNISSLRDPITNKVKDQYFLMAKDVSFHGGSLPELDHVVFDGGGMTLTLNSGSSLFNNFYNSVLKNINIVLYVVDGCIVTNGSFANGSGGNCLDNVKITNHGPFDSRAALFYTTDFGGCPGIPNVLNNCATSGYNALWVYLNPIRGTPESCLTTFCLPC